MRRVFLCLATVILMVSASSRETPKMAMPTHVAMAPAAMQWTDAPAALPPGAKIAVLEGDPGGGGFFVLRMKLPDGYRVMPHWHPTRERVTVISGKFGVGMGDTFDAAKGEVLPAGSFTYLDATMHHYAWAEGDSEIQVDAMGPFVINYVSAADDPSKMKK